MKKYYPLILAESYLVLTVILFVFGPIRFNYHNQGWLLFFLTFYHLSFILGYVIATITFRTGPPHSQSNASSFSRKKFVFLLFFACISTGLTYKNLMLTSSLSLTTFIENVIRGFAESGAVYTERMRIIAEESYDGSRLVNIMSVFFMFTKFLFIFYSIYYWQFLNRPFKCLFFAFSILYIAPGIAAGINVLNFYLFIFSFSALIVKLYVSGSHRTLKWGFILSLLTFTSLVLLFGHHMSLRGGGFSYFRTTSPLGDISINFKTPELANLQDYISYSIVWLDYYLTQGYYGLSLALSERWDWTYGFGSTAFLQNQFLHLTNINISELTFQYKISHHWAQGVQWHSFYSEIANDVGFVGVGPIMFVLGMVLSRSWLMCIFKNNFYASALLPIYAIFLIFIPANNQILNNIETISYVGWILLYRLSGHLKLKTYLIGRPEEANFRPKQGVTPA